MSRHYVSWARLERARDVFDARLDRPDPNFGRASLADIVTAGHGCPLSRVKPQGATHAPAKQMKAPERNLSPVRRGYEADPFSLDASQQWGASHARAHSRFTDRKISDALDAEDTRKAVLAHAERRAPAPLGQRTRGEIQACVAAAVAAHEAFLQAVVQDDPLFGMSDEQIIEEMLHTQRRIIGDE